MPAMLAADMETINRYIMTASIKTAAAEKVKKEWMQWWKDNEKTFLWYSTEEFDAARNFRKKFDTANASTPSQKKVVEEHYSGGVTAEEMRGDARRAGSDGSYLEDEKPLVDVTLHPKLKWGLIISGVLAGGLWVAKKVYIDPVLPSFPKRPVRRPTRVYYR